MIKQLVKLADHLDKKGLTKEADYIDTLIKKASGGETLFDIENDEYNSSDTDLEIETYVNRLNKEELKLNLISILDSMEKSPEYKPLPIEYRTNKSKSYGLAVDHKGWHWVWGDDSSDPLWSIPIPNLFE